MGYDKASTIAEVIKNIEERKYVLPSIQREFVWKPDQIVSLFDSIMQGYPFGAFLFWLLPPSVISKYDFYSFLSKYHEKYSRHNEKTDIANRENIKAVLDGQQRLTSLYIGLKGSYASKIPYKRKSSNDAYPEKKLYLNLYKYSDVEGQKYDFAFLADDEVCNDKDHCWFRVGKILELTNLSMVTQFVLQNVTFANTDTNEIPSKEKSMAANNILAMLFQVVHVEKCIASYQIVSEEMDKVLNIFIRVNSGGTILSYSDLLLSVASAQWEQLDAREEITRFVDDINENGFNVNKDFVLKAALVLSDFSNIAFKVDNFNKENMLKIESNWEKITTSLSLAFKLISSFGFSKENLSANYVAIPIAYYLLKIGLPSNFDSSSSTVSNRAIIKKWMILSLIKGVFGGAPDAILKPIREIIKNNESQEFPLQKIEDHFRGQNKTILISDDDIENLLSYEYKNQNTKSILMFLYPSLDYRNKFHVDHMYPKSKFNKKYLLSRGIAEEKIDDYISKVNNICNLQMLEAIPNIEKQNEDFNVWLEQNYPKVDQRNSYAQKNYLPSIDYTYENFELFLEKRKELLKAKLKEILSSNLDNS